MSPVTNLRGRWSLRVALAAAYMLVLQSIVGALALGIGPDASQVDAFGNPLCITSTDATDGGMGGADHSKLPNCCTFGCSLFSSALATPPESGTSVVRRADQSDGLARGYDLLPAVSARDHEPGSPRAPPLMA